MKVSNFPQVLLCVFMLIGSMSMESSQEAKSTQEFIKSLPEGWETAQGLLFVVNSISSIMSIFSSMGNINVFFVGDNGTLTPIKSIPFKARGQWKMAGYSLALSGGYLFIANRSSHDISVFSIEDDGSLKLVEGSPFPSGGDLPNALAVSGDGQYLFVANQGSDNIAVFSIRDNGALMPVVGSPFSGGVDSPNSLAIGKNGRYLFVTNRFRGSVSVLNIAYDGSLAQVTGSPFLVESIGDLASIAISKGGRYLYVAHSYFDHVLFRSSSGISVFSIGDDGSLAQIAGSPFLAGGSIPKSLAISKDGHYLYVANQGSDNVSALKIAYDGSLAQVTGSPFSAAGEWPNSLAISEDGHYLYVLNPGSNNVNVFSIEDNGLLTMISGAPFSSRGRRPGSILMTPLPERWRDLQKAQVAASLYMAEDVTPVLPMAIKKEIIQMIHGSDKGKLEELKKAKITASLGMDISNVTIGELAEYLYQDHYDKDRVAGGWLQAMASPFVAVQQGNLTPEGFRLLEAWAREKNSKELEEAVEIMQELLHGPEISPERTRAFKVVRERLMQLYNMQLAREQE